MSDLRNLKVVEYTDARAGRSNSMYDIEPSKLELSKTFILSYPNPDFSCKIHKQKTEET